MMNPLLDKLHLNLVNKPLEFQVGDLVKVHYKIKEGNKERIQIYEGLVITIQNRGAAKSFTVRRVSFDVGVERIFPLYSPSVEKIEVIRSNKVKKSKLYYLRDKIGKAGRLKEIKRSKPQDKMFERAEASRVVLETPAPAPVDAPVDAPAAESDPVAAATTAE